MKIKATIKLFIFSLAYLLAATQVFSFQSEKVRPRLSVGFYNDMENGYHIKIRARARGEEGYYNLTEIPVKVYKIHEEEETELGVLTTDEEGSGLFKLTENMLKADSTGVMTYEARLEGVEGYRNASSDVEAMMCDVEINFVERDSLGFVTAKLVNALGEPLSEEDITFYLKRSFRPLTIGDDFVSTDEEGMAEAELATDLPATLNGTITVGVFIDDHYLYGTVRQEKTIEYGQVPEISNAFHERTMWGTRDKTPLWLLIFPNLILISVWGVILFLVHKLYIISKL